MKQLSNKITQLRYYKAQGISIMNRIEDATGMTIDQIDSDLEAKFWRAYDNDCIPSLRRTYLALCELHDFKTMDQ